jgi:hypothetical protein
MPEISQFIQNTASVVTAFAAAFAFWQVKIAARQLEKQTDKSATEFVLNAEGQFDGMYEALFDQESSVIRLCYEKEVDPSWSDEEIKKFVFLLRYYGHISRMVYLVRDQTLDIGMTADERDELLKPWEARLAIFRDDKIMNKIHSNALNFKNYNERMLDLSVKVFGQPNVPNEPE